MVDRSQSVIGKLMRSCRFYKEGGGNTVDDGFLLI